MNAARPVLKKIELQITTACNMHCPFCFAEAGSHARHLSPELAARAIRQTALHASPEIRLESVWLTGGEPLLEAAACKSLIETASAHGLTAGIATNGLLLTRYAAALMHAGLREARVSLDAAQPGLFDTMRGTHRAFRNVLKGIETAAACGVRTGIRFTATKENAGEFARVLQLARECGAVYAEVKGVLPIGRASAKAMLDPQSLFRLYGNALALSSAQMPVTVLCSTLPPCEGFSSGPGFTPCVCATESLYVSVSGDVLPCSYFPQTSLFNIAQRSLPDAWTSAALEQARDARPAACRPCAEWNSCRNGCPALLAHYRKPMASCFRLVESLARN